MGKKKKIALPKPGEAFLMPLADGRFGVCRVLRGNTKAERVSHGEDCVLVAGSPWIGDRAPDLNDGQIREILKLTHHGYKNEPDLTWVSDPPPDIYQKLGIIEPTAADKRRLCLASGYWFSEYHVLMNWRWKHDRAAVDHEEAVEVAETARARQDALRRYAEAKDALTLAELKKKRRFPDWKGYVPDRVIPVCRKIFRDTIDALVALGDKPVEAAVMPILQSCIEQLNDADERNDHFIETTIREELCEEFEEIVHACGLHNHDDLADEWRDW